MYVQRTLRAVAAALVATSAAVARAEAAPPADAPAELSPAERRASLPQFREEIVVKGKRLPRVDTLEAREVRETAARDLGEALDAHGDVAKVRKGGIASDVVVRGMKRDDVNVLIDGAKVHGACPSRMDPPAFHLDYAEVDRVEVKKGPFDVRNPGGLGGLVDVRTRRAALDAGAEVNAEYGSFQSSQASAVLSYGTERADLQLGGAFKYGQPYLSGDGRNFTEAVPATLGGLPNGARYRNTSPAQKAYSVASGFGKAGLAPAEGQRLELSYTRQSADDVLYPYLLMDGTVDTTDRVNASWRRGPSGALASALAQVYFSRVRHDMDDRGRCSASADPASCLGALPQPYGMRTEARATVLGGRLEVGTVGDTELLAGADFYVRGWDNTTTRVARAMPGRPYVAEASVPDVRIANLGFYAQARRRLGDRLRLTAGVRLDAADTEARIDRSDLYRTFHPGTEVGRSRTDVLLSGNVQLELGVLSRGTLFAGVGHGARVPDPQERYYALSGMGANPGWVGFPALRPVKSDELDLGARWADGPLLLKVQAFHAWVADDIVLADATAAPAPAGTPRVARTYANVNARLYGGEASAKVALPSSLFFTGAASYTRGLDLTGRGNLPEIPPLRLSAGLRYDTGAFFAEVEEVYAARQDRVAASLHEEPTAAWFITNLRAGVQHRGWRGFLGVRNLLDKFYYEHLGYLRDPFTTGTKVPEPGRAFYGSLQYAL